MSRREILVDPNLLKKSVQEAEKDGPLPNLSKLWEKTVEIYNSQRLTEIFPAITISVALLRIEAWKSDNTLGFDIKTQKGRRGRPTGSTNTVKDTSATVEDNSEDDGEMELSVKLMVQDTPDKFKKLAAKAQKSRTAAMRLKCLDCCGWQRQEVANCACRNCPLWSWRPYQNRADFPVEPTEKVEVEPVNSASTLVAV